MCQIRTCTEFMYVCSSLILFVSINISRYIHVQCTYIFMNIYIYIYLMGIYIYIYIICIYIYIYIVHMCVCVCKYVPVPLSLSLSGSFQSPGLERQWHRRHRSAEYPGEEPSLGKAWVELGEVEIHGFWEGNHPQINGPRIQVSDFFRIYPELQPKFSLMEGSIRKEIELGLGER